MQYRNGFCISHITKCGIVSDRSIAAADLIWVCYEHVRRHHRTSAPQSDRVSDVGVANAKVVCLSYYFQAHYENLKKRAFTRVCACVRVCVFACARVCVLVRVSVRTCIQMYMHILTCFPHLCSVRVPPYVRDINVFETDSEFPSLVRAPMLVQQTGSANFDLLRPLTQGKCACFYVRVCVCLCVCVIACVRGCVRTCLCVRVRMYE